MIELGWTGRRIRETLAGIYRDGGSNGSPPATAGRWTNVLHAELAENRHHRAPVRERGLKQVQPHECREQKPRRVHLVAQSHTEHHEESGDQPEITFDSHASFLLSIHNEIDNRYGHAREGQRSDFTGHQRDCQALKNGVEENHGGPHHHGRGGQHHGTEADRAGIDHGGLERHALASAAAR